MTHSYRGNDIPFAGCGVVCYSYGFDPKKVRSYTAPFVRLFTGQLFNHGALYVVIDGQTYMLESAEGGVKRFVLIDELDRKKARIRVCQYTGTVDPETVYSKAVDMLHTKYDTPALFHQLIYRVTGAIARAANNFLGREKYRGIWLGLTGEAAKGRYGCFEFIYHAFGFENPHYASGAEFVRRSDFKTVFSEF